MRLPGISFYYARAGRLRLPSANCRRWLRSPRFSYPTASSPLGGRGQAGRSHSTGIFGETSTYSWRPASWPPFSPGGKVVSIVYDLIPLRLPSLFPQRDAFREQILQLLRRSSTVLAISEHTKQDLVELLGEDPLRVFVAHPGQGRHMHPVPSSEFLRVIQRYRIHTPYILYVGSLGPHKNVITLLRAYETARLDGRITGQLVLVGSDRWGADSLRVLETLRVRKDVVLTGFAPAADLPALYSGAACLVFPSLYEGFGLPVLEAMACGTPVIASNRGALPEVVGEAGTLVDPLDADAFAKAICDLFNTPARRAERSARASAQAATFSWDRSAAKVMTVLHQTADISASD